MSFCKEFVHTGNCLGITLYIRTLRITIDYNEIKELQTLNNGLNICVLFT